MLKKLSLAALVAMGSMSVASATDLSQAIQGVDFGGYLRLRAYNDNSSKTATTNRYRTTALFKFTIPVSEDVKFKTDYSYDWNIYSDQTVSGGNTPANAHFYLQYSKSGLTALAGKLGVVTPVTGAGVGEAIGAGAIGMYKLNDSLTFAAAGLDDLINVDNLKAFGNSTKGNNTYAAAAIFSNSMVNAQIWAFEVDKLINYDYVVMADIKALKDMGVDIHVDYAKADIDKSLSNYKQTFKNINATYSKDGVCAKVGFAANGKNGGVVSLDHDSALSAVFPTEQVTGISGNTGNLEKGDKAFYAKVGYTLNDKVSPYVAYTKADDAGTEALVGAKYAYTKKFGIKVYYSVLGNVKNGNGNKEARAEFKYTF